MIWYFWHYHTSNPGHDHILIILKTMSIIKWASPEFVPGIRLGGIGICNETLGNNLKN